MRVAIYLSDEHAAPEAQLLVYTGGPLTSVDLV
jgi:hypothetical protein